MFCNKCGNKLNDGTSFCPKCGNPISQPQAPVNAPATPVAPQKKDAPKVAPQKKDAPKVAPKPQPVKKEKTEKAKPEKKKKKGGKIVLIILALLLVFGIIICCAIPIAIFGIKNSSETKAEGVTYIEDFPVIKNQTDLYVYDEANPSMGAYEVYIEKFIIGGAIKDICARSEVSIGTSSDPVYELNLADGDYRITITPILPSYDEYLDDYVDEYEDIVDDYMDGYGDVVDDYVDGYEDVVDDYTIEDETASITIIDVKVAGDDEQAIDSVNILGRPMNNLVEEPVEEPEEEIDEADKFIEATDADFDEFMNYISAVGTENFDYQTATTKDVIEGKITQYTNERGYMYFFEKDINESNYWDIYSKYQHTGPDPKKVFDMGDGVYYFEYYKFPVENIKWICEEIYNIEFNGDYTSENTYVYENYLYKVLPTVGDGCWTEYEMVNHTLNNDKYEIIVDTYDCSYGEIDTYKTLASTKKITAEIKIIDGERYWSIYKIEDYNVNS